MKCGVEDRGYLLPWPATPFHLNRGARPDLRREEGGSPEILLTPLTSCSDAESLGPFGRDAGVRKCFYPENKSSVWITLFAVKLSLWGEIMRGL